MNPTRLSRLESAVRTVLAFNEACNRQDTTAMLQLISADCVLETTSPAPQGERFSGKESVASYWQGFFRDLHHSHIHVEEIFGLGERCVLRWRYDWEDENARKGYIRGVDICQVRDGLIREILSYVKG